ncbi:MAG: hypothetical protein ACLRRI_05520 [Oscillospiraceae bacterium]|jgi:mobA/mobL protein
MPIASLPCIRTWHSNIRPVLFANGIWRPELERYTSLVQQIKEKTRERTALIRGKKELPFLRIICSRELAVRLAELTEELEELRTENALLLQKFEHVEDAGAEVFRRDIATMEAGLKKLEAQEQHRNFSRK